MLWHYLIHRAALRRRPRATPNTEDDRSPLEPGRGGTRASADRVIVVIFFVALVASLVVAWAGPGGPDASTAAPSP